MSVVKWTVRVILEQDQEKWADNPLIECLRRSGALRVLHRAGDATRSITMNPIRGDATVLEIRVLPSGSKASAEQDAERWQSHGFNAVAAPEWRE